MPTLQRFEVWSDFQCASGTRQAVIPKDAPVRITTTQRTTRDDEGTLEISKDAPGASVLAAGAVLRFLYSDASFDEWRIAEVVDTSRQDRLVRVSLRNPLQELNVRSAPVTTTTGGITALDVSYAAKTPAAHVATILGFAPAWFTAGTITPTVLVELTLSSDFPLGALRQLVAAIRAKGVDCELDVRRNGTSGYYVDLVTAIGAAANPLDVRTGKNLLETQRQQTLLQQASSVTVVGASGTRRSGVPATMALGFWRVASVTGSDVELRGAESCPDPIAYDDQFNGAYIEKTDGTYTQITDSVASTQTVTVASATGISANQRLRVVKDSSGTDLVTVSNPTTTAPINQATILALGARSDRTNWAANPIFNNWTAGAPDDWTETDAPGYLTVSQSTTVYLYGSSSAKCVLNQPGGGSIFNGGLASRSFAVAPSATSRTWQASVWLYCDKSLSTGTPNGTFTLSIGAGTATVTYSAIATQTWTRLDASTTMNGTAVTASLKYASGSNTAQGVTWYVGGLLIEELASVQSSLVIGSDPAFSLAAANRWLRLNSTPPTAYHVSFVNFAEYDPAAFPFDGIEVGQTANVRDVDLGATISARILELKRDWRNPTASAITAATRPPDLITLLSGIS